MLGAFLAYTGLELGLPLWAAIPCAIAVTTVIGMLIERIARRPLENAPWIAPLLSTLAITFVFDQVAEIIWTPEVHAFPSPLAGHAWVVGAAYVTGVDLAILVVSTAILAGLWLFLTRTWTGRALRAMSQDLDAARQMGIDVEPMCCATVRWRSRARPRRRVPIPRSRPPISAVSPVPPRSRRATRPPDGALWCDQGASFQAAPGGPVRRTRPRAELSPAQDIHLLEGIELLRAWRGLNRGCRC